jgi:hypothetical protein
LLPLTQRQTHCACTEALASIRVKTAISFMVFAFHLNISDTPRTTPTMVSAPSGLMG